VSFLRKLFLGETPPVFIAEVALRIAILYLVLVVAMRAMGRRMSSQLTRTEMLALVALAGAIGPAVQDPKRGLLPPMLSALVIVASQRLMARLTLASERFEGFLQGDAAPLVQDGVLQLDAMRHNAISRERLFAELRAKGLYALGAVQAVYLESSGAFCLVRRDTPQPGLSLVPEWDRELLAQQRKVSGQLACGGCGTLREHGRDVPPCARCGNDCWTHAVDAAPLPMASAPREATARSSAA
jgi:uncharacterized membrane protein YcaP (DUF421 family)